MLPLRCNGVYDVVVVADKDGKSWVELNASNCIHCYFYAYYFQFSLPCLVCSWPLVPPQAMDRLESKSPGAHLVAHLEPELRFRLVLSGPRRRFR